MPAEPPEVQEEGLVNKKITSLSLSKVELETKISKPRFVPEKLDFQLYEKFEGIELVMPIPGLAFNFEALKIITT